MRPGTTPSVKSQRDHDLTRMKIARHVLLRAQLLRLVRGEIGRIALQSRREEVALEKEKDSRRAAASAANMAKLLPAFWTGTPARHRAQRSQSSDIPR